MPPSRVTTALAATTVAAWFVASAVGMSDRISLAAGFIPARLMPGGDVLVSGFGMGGISPVPAWLTPLSATLVHAGLAHLAFNMLMLVFCGRFVEMALGGRGMALLYGVGAYAGAFGQLVADPHGLVPMVGASGAISALFGAYALLFGERRGRLADHRFGKALHIAWLAGAWIAFQFLVGFATAQQGTTIAVAAHIGGFIAGLISAKPILRWRYRRA